jgi:SAM-dependent methyltransferase
MIYIYIIILTLILVIIYVLYNTTSINNLKLIVPYTINNNEIDYIHYGYFENINTDDFYLTQQNLVDILTKNIKINENDKILDVGCGVGGFIKYLNNNYSNITIIGLDINYIHLSIAKNKNSKIDKKNIIIYKNIDIIDFNPVYKIDKIFAIECGFHFNKNIFLSNAFRYLENNGEIIIADIVTTNKIVDIINYKKLIDKIILESFGVFYNFWNPFDYVTTMQKIGYNNIQYIDITKETIKSYFYLEKYANDKTIKGIKLLKKLHNNGYLKYVILKAKKIQK